MHNRKYAKEQHCLLFLLFKLTVDLHFIFFRWEFLSYEGIAKFCLSEVQEYEHNPSFVDCICMSQPSCCWMQYLITII